MKISLCAVVLISWATLCLSGCTDSIYFYETEKISLATVEARPDATAPIAGSFGLKQRVVAFGPPKSDQVADEGRGHDTVALVSFFRFDKRDVPGFFNDPVQIETALLTGDAAYPEEEARSLYLADGGATHTEQQIAGRVVSAFNTFTRLAAPPSRARLATMTLIYRDLKKMGPEAEGHIDAMDQLARYLPERYPVPVFQRSALNGNSVTLTVRAVEGEPVRSDSFHNVTQYRSNLVDNIDFIDEALSKEIIVINERVLDEAARQRLQNERQRSIDALNEIETLLRRDSTLAQVRQWYLSQ